MKALAHQFASLALFGVWSWGFVGTVSADVDPLGDRRPTPRPASPPASVPPQPLAKEKAVSRKAGGGTSPHASWKQRAGEWLGDAQLADEVARFNACDPARPVPDRPLLNPTEARRPAEGALARAADAVAQAGAMEAARFAPAEWAVSERALAEARAARSDARYAIAVSLAERCAVLAEQATRAARAAAIVPLPLGVHSVEGPGRLANRGAKEAVALVADAAIRAGDSLFTETGARIQIGLPGLGQVTLSGDGELSLITSRKDEMARRVETAWRLDTGRLAGQVVPASGESQQCEVELGPVTVRMERAAFEIFRGGDLLTVRVVDGEALVQAAWGTETVEAGQVFIQRQDSDPRVIALPGPVAIHHPLPQARIPGGRAVRVEWTAVPDAAHYVIRVFRSADHVVPLREERVGGTRWVGTALPAGEYVVSVVAAVAEGLVGDEGAGVPFEVLPQLAVEVGTRDPHTVDSDGVVVAAGGIRFDVVPGAGGGDVKTVEWRLDVGEYAPWVQPVSLFAGGAHRLVVRGVSADGVKGSEVETRIWIDTEGPVVKHAVLAAVDFPNDGRRIPVAVAASDRSGGVTMRWRRPGGSWQAVTDYFSVPAGRTTAIEIEARDRWGNKSLLPIVVTGR